MRHRIALRTLFIAAAPLLVAACAGGSSSGGSSSFKITAPAAATEGASSGLDVTAAAGGPTFAGGGGGPVAGTVFPMQQSALHLGSSSAMADATTNSAGGTILITGAQSLAISIPGIGLSGLTLTCSGCAANSWTGTWSGTQGDGQLILTLNSLNYTSFGNWTGGSVTMGGISSAGAAVYGYKTPTANVPASGTATYSGTNNVQGALLVSSGNYLGLTGNGSFAVNFGNNAVTGTFTGMTIANGGGGLAWNNVALTGTISGNSFNGTTSTPAAVTTNGGLGATATGLVNGGFFGPNAQELGAVWSLTDGKATALGSVGATKQ